MDGLIRFVGPQRALEVLGVRLVGVNAENGVKLLFTVGLVWAVVLVSRGVRRAIERRGVRWRSSEWGAGPGDRRVGFWARQGLQVASAVVITLGIVSIWFDDPVRLTTAVGLVTAGLAFALQRVVTALAGYVLILRGSTFNVGDRIVMGGVRGDVVALGFLQTTIMEMGQPPPVQGAPPAMWVRSRQYTGRIVTVSNAKVFDEPVYNYSREFAYIWEEMSIPVSYRDDAAVVERLLLKVAARHTTPIQELSEPQLTEIERRYGIARSDVGPRVYYRMTDNWLELTVRFIAREHGIRDLKDAMTRDVVGGLRAAGIGVASATFEVTGVPPVRVVGAEVVRAEAGKARAGRRKYDGAGEAERTAERERDGEAGDGR